MDCMCNKNDCTLCMACANSCPRNAISVGVDEYGYECISIDQELCVDCGLCKRVCESRSKIERNIPSVGYAAQAKKLDELAKSASGGAFQMLAQYVLEQGGVCYGCNATLSSDGYVAKHMRVDSLDELPAILNTKYVPSRIGDTFKQAKNDLRDGKLVLFSGTPCQILGLKAYLQKEYENLLAVDIICHGVTAAKIFNDYLLTEEEKYNIKITDYMFRDKSISWGTNFCYSYYKKGDKTHRIKVKHLPREGSSYTIHYLRGDICRENCYSCTLSNVSRVSDFTLGDYWSIEMEHPEFMTKKKPPILLRKGVSCILANTEKGEQYAEILADKMIIHEVSVKSITSHNGNLRAASPRGASRDRVLNVYKEYGYQKIQEEYDKTVGKKMLIYRTKNMLKSILPDRIRIFIYNNPKLRKIVFHS